MLGVPLGERRQFVAELQQQLQPLASLQFGEVVGDLLQCCRKVAHATGVRPGTCPGSSPFTIGTRTALPHSVHEPS